MKKLARLIARTTVPSALSVVCVSLGMFFPVAGEVYAAERTVLCEEFTNQWCSSCADAATSLDMLLEVYDDSMSFVQFHMYDQFTHPWGDARKEYYGITSPPVAVFDGIDMVAGAVHDANQQYRIYRTNHLLPQGEVPTDVTLTLSAVDLGSNTYRISAEVGIEMDGTAKLLEVYMVQVLDHWPPDRDYYRNGFKQGADAQVVAVPPGGSQTVQADFVLDEDSIASPENVKIIAWAQSPASGGVKDVYQSATLRWPLVMGPLDVDGDGWINVIDNCPNKYNPLQENGDLDDFGDACDNCPGLTNPDQANADDDLVGDACDPCPNMHHLNVEDGDGDGVGDACDACPELSGNVGVDSVGRPLGAVDIDCDVDLDDYAAFADCLAGPGETTPPPGCTTEHFAKADVNADGDVDVADFSVLASNFTGPLVSPALYVGADSCTACHAERHADWMGTIHSTAFDTLVASGAGTNELCYPCHSVGYGTASGFVDLATTPQFADIQCENCHGPGSNHVADPVNVRMSIDYSSELCGSCHQSCHGLCGDNHHPQFEQWSTSQHKSALDDAMWQMDYQEDCLRCHSTEYRLAPDGNKPGMYEVFYGITCVACHTAHSVDVTGQLRLPHEQLCADCHTIDGAGVGESPLQSQSEMLHSEAGLALDGSPLVGPYSEHWWGIANECSACHVHEEPYGGPEQPVNSGHTFAANMRACEPCHSEEVATQLVASTQLEIQTRLDLLARYFDSGDPLYVDPSGLSPEELAQYEIAHFDYGLVQADRSLGTHNPAYARALLQEIEDYFGIPPWYRSSAPDVAGLLLGWRNDQVAGMEVKR